MNKKINIYLMYAVVFFQGFVFYGPIATVYRQSRGINLYDIFIIESISWILMILFEVPWGFFADRFGYKLTIVLSNLMFLISKIIFYKSYSFEMFLMERVFISLALSGLSGCDIALLYGSIEGENSEKVFGRYSAFSTIGFIIASFLTTFIVNSPIDKASIDRTGFFTIIPYVIAFLISLFIRDIKVNKEEKPKLFKSFRKAFKNKHILYLVLSAALAREVTQAITVFLNQNQYLRSGIDIKYFGMLLVLIQIVRLFSAKAYVLSDKLGKNRSIQILYYIIMLSCVFLILTYNPIVSVLSIMFISVCMSLIEPITLEIENKSINTEDRATMLSIYAMVGDIAAVIFNPVIGRAADISLNSALLVCIIICIVINILFLLYKKIQNQKDNIQIIV